MCKLIAYYEHPIAYGVVLKVLKPTGRWKIKTDYKGKCHMFVEHKHFFASWIHESGIQFLPQETETVNDCNGKKTKYR